MDGSLSLIVTVVAGVSLVGVIGLTVLIGLRFQKARQQLVALAAELSASASSSNQARVDRAAAEVAQLNETIAWLEQAKTEAEKAAGAAASDLESRQAALAEAVKLLNAGQHEIAALQTQRQALVDEANRVREGLERERQAQAKLSAEMATAQERRSDLFSSIKELSQRREALIEDAAGLTSTLSAHRAELSVLSAELEARRAALQDHADHKVAAEDLRQALTRDRESMAALNEEITALQRRQADSLAVVREIEQRREALIEERMEAQRDRDNAKVEAVRLRAESAAINRELEAARTEIAALREESTTTTAELEAKRAGFVTSYNEVTQRHAALTREVAALDRERQVLAGRNAALRDSATAQPAVSQPSPPPVQAALPTLPPPPPVFFPTPARAKPASVQPKRPPAAPVPPPAASKPKSKPVEQAQPPKPALTPAPARKAADPTAGIVRVRDAMVRDTMRTIDGALTSLFGKPAAKRRAAPPAPAKPKAR